LLVEIVECVVYACMFYDVTGSIVLLLYAILQVIPVCTLNADVVSDHVGYNVIIIECL